MNLMRMTALVLIGAIALAAPAEAAKKRKRRDAAKPPAQTKPEKQFPIGAQWRLVEMNGRPVPANLEATLTIDANLRGSGRSGCNSWASSMWPVRNQRIIAGGLALTRKMCPPPVMQFERAYLSALHSGPNWDTQGDRLTVTGKGGRLVFRRGL